MSNSNSAEQLIEASFNVIRGDLEDMKVSMSKMADALSKIAVLEERHQAMSTNILRVTEKLEKIAERQSALELVHVKQDTTIKVTIKAIQVAWAVLGAGILYGVWQVIKLTAAQG